MNTRCEWLGDKWVDDGPKKYSAGLEVQPQICTACGERRDYNEHTTVEKVPKAKLWAKRLIFVLLLALPVVIWRFLKN